MKQQTSIFILFIFFSLVGKAQQNATENEFLNRHFNLGGNRSTEIQYFKMESRLNSFTPAGKVLGRDIFRLQIKYIPVELSGKGADEITCLKFTIQLGDSAEIEIPGLRNWSYLLKISSTGMDEKNQLFGIDHNKFEKLADANGNVIPPDKIYHIYNAFVDFHSFCNVFAEKMEGGNGIQDLHTIGQSIIHLAAYSEGPVNLGSTIEQGSTFTNGKITLELKGLSLVNNIPCALIGYDSGESSFKMKVKPMPNMEILTEGSSHYFGDIYKDLKSNWIQKVTLNEYVGAETTLPMPPNKLTTINTRSIIVENIK